MTNDIRDYIRTIPDFPHEGILFRDITTLFGSAEGLRLAIAQTVAALKDLKIDKVAGLEARGFIMGGAVAQSLGVGFIPIRKKGKLPGKTISQEYQLEYGTATLELHDDAIEAGERILLLDDLIATGGTAEAGIKLIETLGGVVVQSTFIIDLPDLGGAAKINAMGVPVHVLCAFEGL
jgi:adenine phosphoribosyltransferase